MVKKGYYVKRRYLLLRGFLQTLGIRVSGAPTVPTSLSTFENEMKPIYNCLIAITSYYPISAKNPASCNMLATASYGFLMPVWVKV